MNSPGPAGSERAGSEGAGPEQIAEAVRRLVDGGVVAFPTETVYGLGAVALDERAVGRVFELKGRPASNPLIVHVSGPEMARAVVRSWPAEAEAAAERFWPGPLAVVLARRAEVPAIVTGGLDTVAVRCPDHPLTLALIEAVGTPLVGPSANPSGLVSPTRPEHVREHFRPEDVYVLDGGPCVGGIESTVVQLQGPARILRPGLVAAEEIGAAIGRAVQAHRTPHAGEPAAAPGAVGPHYRTRAPVRLYDAGALEAILRSAAGPAIVLARTGAAVAAPHRVLAMPAGARAFAAALYATLRRADADTPALILVERPPESGRDPGETAIWSAIGERLGRAAEADA